jgi:uncharacterized protein YegP (UPF0339 family)
MAAEFEVYRDQGEKAEWRFRFRVDGDIKLKSEGYTEKASALGGIASVKENAPNEAQYDRKLTESGKPMFNLKARNGEVIGTSEIYTFEGEGKREADIAAIKEHAANAGISELA